MANDPYRLVGAESSIAPLPHVRRRKPVVPASWDEGLLDEHDEKAFEHYRLGRMLRRILREKFDIRPEDFYPTKDLRGVVKLTIPELYWIVYEPDDQPKLLCNGAKVRDVPQGTKKLPEGKFTDPMSVQHREEVEEARAMLSEDFQIFPRSVVPTRDFRGRVQFSFEEMVKLLRGVIEVEELDAQE